MEAGASRSTKSYQTQNAIIMITGSQTTGDKFRGQKGKSPDLQLRSQNGFKGERMCSCEDN